MNTKSADSRGNQAAAAAPAWPRSLAASAWIVLVAVGFWGPYLHMPISMALLTGLYGVFVLVGAASAALGLLRRGKAGEN